LAKELPYFRFTCQEWDAGDISLESDSVKGIYISICSYYWIKNCSVLYQKLIKKFPKKIQKIKYLIENDIIKIDGDYIKIIFLDLQLAEITDKHNKLSSAGKRGVEIREAKKHGTLKPPLSNKDKDKDNDKEKDKDNIKAIVNCLNLNTHQNFRWQTLSTQKLIRARIKEGFNLKSFFVVIEKKSLEWMGDLKMRPYLRPETLFGGKFEGYLNQPSIQSEGDRLSKIYHIKP